MQAMKRRRLGAEAWRTLVGRYGTSGLTVAAFCRRESVSAACFYRWRGQLSVAATDATALPVARAIAQGKTEFVDLGALGTTEPSSRFELRLDLGGGVMLQLRRG